MPSEDSQACTAMWELVATAAAGINAGAGLQAAVAGGPTADSGEVLPPPRFQPPYITKHNEIDLSFCSKELHEF